ncbi:MAG: hypothetical protein HKN03_17015 [Acidimicrobiales bacterium]|nr:hypothetical protein [Acidimicrobiales bacterium]
MSELPPAQFRKTKAGKWAVMAPIESLEAALATGGQVDVLKKSGDWSKFTVASLGKPFDVDGVSMCYGYGPDDDAAEGERRPARPIRASSVPADEPAPSDASWANAPERDQSEPIPEYRGEPEDEWHDGF